MAIYEFHCFKCNKKFEVFWRKNGFPDSHKCPDCGELSPRLLSIFNFQFSPYLKELREGNMLDY